MKAQDLTDLDKGGTKLFKCVGDPIRSQSLSEIVLIRYSEDLRQTAGITYKTIAQ